MSRGLPVPVRPEVIVVEPAGRIERRSSALARLAVSLTPEVLDVVERALAQRRSTRPATSPQRARAPQQDQIDMRTHTHAVQHSELEIHTWSPFPRRVRVTTTTHWTTSSPTYWPQVDDIGDGQSPLLRRAGIGALGVGGALALATLGVLANRGGKLRRR